MAKHNAKKAKPKSPSALAKAGASVFAMPSRLSSEQMLRDIHKVLEQHEFQSIDEANAFLATMTGTGLQKALSDVPPPSPQEEAQALAYQALDAPTNARAIALARQALAKDPDCVDAIVALTAANESSAAGVIAGLERAVAAGERSLGADFFRENKGHFWGIVETRPYMRARYELADALLAEERVADAVRHFEALIELNPNDNQGIRDILLGCYLETDNLDGARRLFLQYKGDAGAVFQWGRVLERILSGDFSSAARALKTARRDNRFIELFMMGTKKFPNRMPDFYSPGSEEEALVCLDALSGAWANHPEAMIWVAGQIHGIFEMDSAPAGQTKLSF